MAGVATFCGRCGNPLAPGATFCGRCGTPVARPAAAATVAPPAAQATAPPMTAGPSVAAAPPAFGPPYATAAPAAAPPRAKLTNRNTLLFAGGGVAALVVVLTIVAIHLVSSPAHCDFYCAPRTGPRLEGTTAFTDKKWGYIVEYNSDFQIQQPDPNSDSVSFTVEDQNGNTLAGIKFTAMNATNQQQAIQSALQSTFNSSTFSTPQQVQSVDGAEIGEVVGSGMGYTSNLQSGGGGQGTQAAIIILASTHGNVTVVAAMWSVYDNQQGSPPFYLGLGQLLDYPITNFQFPSS